MKDEYVEPYLIDVVLYFLYEGFNCSNIHSQYIYNFILKNILYLNITYHAIDLAYFYIHHLVANLVKF